MVALPPRDQRHLWLRYEGQEYIDTDSVYFEERLERIYDRRVHRVHVFDLGGLTEEMDLGVSARIRMEHNDDQGHVVFTSLAWRRLFKIRRPLLGGVRCHMSWRQHILAMGLHMAEELDSDGFVVYWAEIHEEVVDKGNLSTYWTGISSDGDFLGTVPSYTLIRDSLMRSMDVRAQMFGGYFVACLADHFGLLTEDRLQGLTVVVRNLQMIDMDELVRFWIYDRLGDTWVWVAHGSERQHEAATRVAQVIEFVCCELILDFLDHFHLFANGWYDMDERSNDAIDVLKTYGTTPPPGLQDPSNDPYFKDAWIASGCYGKDHEKKRASSSNTEGSSSSGGCSHKTFMNGKPHSFNGTEGVVGLTRWMEKMEQVFGTCKCAEQDKVVYAASTFEGRALT
ncbi:hypothetical protein Tco_0929720, partial [Tanacetum coccineum]